MIVGGAAKNMPNKKGCTLEGKGRAALAEEETRLVTSGQYTHDRKGDFD